MQNPPLQPRSDFSARLLGLLFATAGVAILYWQVVVPIRAAPQENSQFAYSLKLIMLAEFFVAIGVLWIIRGLSGYQLIRNLKDHRKGMKMLMIGAFVLALISWWGVDKLFAAYGYVMN